MTETRRALLRYGGAIAAVAVATLARWRLNPYLGDHLTFSTYSVAVLLVAWFGGLGPLLLALAMGAAAADVFLLESDGSTIIRGRGAEYVVGLAIFVLVALFAALLSEALRAARRRAEAGDRRQRLLAEAGATLADSLDSETTLAAVAGLIVPQVADGCAIDLIDPDGSARRVAAKAASAQNPLDPRRRCPPDLGDLPGLSRSLLAGRSELIARVDADADVPAQDDPGQREVLLAAGVRSYLGVPLAARGRVLGVMTLAMTDASGRRLGPEDLRLAEDLARRAAVALDNARLLDESRRSARRAEESLALLETLMGSAPIGLAFIDRDLRYVRVNDALAAIDGSRAEQMVGRTLREVIPELAPKVEPLYRRVLETGEPIVGQEVEGETPAWPDQTRHWLVDYYPVRTAGGGVIGVGVVVVDITEKKRTERDLREARDAAEAASRAKDDFLAVLSHELRTPLTPILAEVSARLDDPETPPSLRPLLEMTQRNVGLEARLIGDLLDITKIDRGKLSLDREVADAHALVAQALDICRADVLAGDLRLELDLAASEHFADADPARLQQIAWNLIKNAIKFTPPGGRITIRTRNVQAGDDGDGDGVPGRPRWALEVSDSGIGIEPDALPRIFVPMEQGDPRITRRFGGLGLGLAISRSLAEAHGGTLRAASEGRGLGATFTLELPTVPRPSVAAPEPANGHPEAEAPPGLRILLVEDNADTLHVLRRLLASRGHRVTTATDVASALEAAGPGPIDLLISDIGLPDGTGLDLMQRLRETVGDVRGIALTGFGTDLDQHRSRQAGFVAHLTKPVDFAKLQSTIRLALASPRPSEDGRPAGSKS